MIPPRSSPLPLGPAEEPAFTALAAEAGRRFGAAFTPRGRGKLLAAVWARQFQLDLADLAAYAAVLKADPGEWNRLWPQALTDGGAFFRPVQQFKVAEALLREWAVGAPERDLRVLSLGPGAFEAISLAITLEEAGFRSKNWQVEISGLDLNPEAVARAGAGFFRSDELDGLSDGRRRKWFTPRAGGFIFKAALAPAITLAAGNAYEPETWPWPAASFDLIFCRDLTWEAPPEAPGRLMEILRSVLAPTGFIFTGPGEFLPEASGKLILEERAGVTWYRQGLRRTKANRFHQPRRLRKEAGTAVAPAEEVLAPELALKLVEAERLRTEGRPDEARDLVREVILAFLEQGRPAWAAWAWLAGSGRRED